VLLLVAVAAPGGAATAMTGGGSDPVDGPDPSLDIRAVTHSDDDTTITYTVETFRPLSDDDVDFRWSLDLNGDGRSDLAVATQWESDRHVLVAAVEDIRERVVARATVSRPAPDAVRVTFPRAVLGPVTEYRYTVIGVTDLDHDGETASNERDIAPDSGSFEHRLGSGGPAPDDPFGATTPPPTVAPAAPPPQRTANPAPATGPGGANGASTPSQPGAAARPSPGSPTAAARPAGGATAAGPAADVPPAATIPTTGLRSGGLAERGAGLLLAGLTCTLIARRPRIRRRGVSRCGEPILRG
jgi:hypothetical protein